MSGLKRTVALVGMMGAGKSSLGRRLAARLNVEFRDADTEIEHAAGCSINEILQWTGTGWACSNSGNDVTCTRASIDAQSSVPVITIVATAPATAGTMSNLAAVSSATSDPDTTNNTASTNTLANLFGHAMRIRTAAL